MLDKIGRGFLSSGNNLHLIPIFLTILLHLRVLPTPDHRITVSNEFADIFRIVPDFQHFQAVAAAEDTISQVLHTLRQGHLLQMHPFAKCAAAHRRNLRRKVQLLCRAEIKCFFPDMCKLGGKMNLRQRFAAAECPVTDPGHAVRSSAVHSANASSPITASRLSAANRTS